MYWKENYSMGFTIHYTLYTIYTYTGQDNWHNLFPRRSLLPWAGNFIAHQIILKWFKQQANDQMCQLLPDICKSLIKRDYLTQKAVSSEQRCDLIFSDFTDQLHLLADAFNKYEVDIKFRLLLAFV